MGSRLFDLAVRALNAVLGGFIGFAAVAGRNGQRLARIVGADHDTVISVGTVAVAAVGFIWGARLWSIFDRRADGGWTRRGP